MLLCFPTTLKIVYGATVGKANGAKCFCCVFQLRAFIYIATREVWKVCLSSCKFNEYCLDTYRLQCHLRITDERNENGGKCCFDPTVKEKLSAEEFNMATRCNLTWIFAVLVGWFSSACFCKRFLIIIKYYYWSFSVHLFVPIAWLNYDINSLLQWNHKKLLNQWCIYFCLTVKPVYNGNPRDRKYFLL